MFDFAYERFSSRHRGRLGVLQTPHGTIQTPAFIFCATKASIKGMPMEVMQTLGTQIVLSNTYHLMLQPGAQIVQEAGGLHKFCGWAGPMLTDSGGFQIFSLGHGSVADEIKGRRKSGWEKSTLKLDETGAIFRSYVNGAKYLLTPEKSIDVQRKLGADFIVVLDECTPFHTTKEYTADSMERSHRWGKRCLKEFEKQDYGRQKLYGIIQGGIYEDLRSQSIDFVNSMPFFGHAIGGSLGGDKTHAL